MKILAIIFFGLAYSCFAAGEKADFYIERYFPVGWEPPTVEPVGNAGVVIKPPKPIFDGATKLGAHIEVGNTLVKGSDKIKEVIFRIIANKKAIRIYIGKIFRIGKHRYRFIGVEKENYVIQDLKTKKKIVFTKKPPKKDED